MSISGVAQGKKDLATALRAAAAWDLHEGVCNHFSFMIDENCMLISPQGLHWSEIGADDIVEVDRQGNVLSGDHSVEPTAFFIHRAIHYSHPHASCIMHTHMPYATSLSCLEGGRLLWISQNAVRFYGRVAYDDQYRGLALDGSEGERIAVQCDSADIIFLANHGVVVCGSTISRALDDLYYLERACQIQLIAHSSGQPLKYISDAVASAAAEQFEQERQQADYLLSAAERLYPKL